MTKSRADIKRVETINKELDLIIARHGMESDPILYYIKWVEKDPYNHNRYFETAMNWIFNEEF